MDPDKGTAPGAGTASGEGTAPGAGVDIGGYVSARGLLLDRQIYDVDGEPVGKVDDLEFERRPQGPPVLSALLTGPTAFGPRITGRLGSWWTAIGRRLRPFADPYPNRIPMPDLVRLDQAMLVVGMSRDRIGTDRLQVWVGEHVIGRIPGAG